MPTIKQKKATATPELSNSWLRRFLSAMPLFLLSGTFAWPLHTGRYFSFADHFRLAMIMEIEMIGIVWAMFMTLPLLVMSLSGSGRTVSFLIFAGLAWVFGSIAYDMFGLSGFLSLFLLVFFTYGGIIIWYPGQFHRQVACIEVGLRWFLYLPVFFPLLILFDLGNGNISGWDSKEGVVDFGFWFFLVAGMMELFIFSSMGLFISRTLEKGIGRRINIPGEPVELPDTALRRKKFYDALRRKRPGH